MDMPSPQLMISPIPALKDNYVWAIIDPAQHTAWVVDPSEAKPVNEFLTQHQLTLTGILITHHHWDHTGGIAELISHYPVPVFAPAKENIVGVTHQVHEGDEIKITPSFSLQVLEIPGHTLGHVAYYAPGIIFCGDTLFAAGCGRVFEGTMEQMYSSLQKIASLPDDTNIYCAHEYTLNNLRFAKLVEPNNQDIDERMKRVEAMRQQHKPSLPSTLKEEKATNPFLRCHQPEIVANLKRRTNLQSIHSIDIFSQLREWKDKF